MDNTPRPILVALGKARANENTTRCVRHDVLSSEQKEALATATLAHYIALVGCIQFAYPSASPELLPPDLIARLTLMQSILDAAGIDLANL